MGLHEELLRQLLNAIEEGKKLEEINKLIEELEDVCKNLGEKKDTLIDRIKKEEDLSHEDKENIEALNDRYNNAMDKLRKLILK